MNSITVELEKQKSQLLAVKRADESGQDLALHSLAEAQQSDQQPWNYKPQQLARINQANIEYKRRQKECDEKERKRERADSRMRRVTESKRQGTEMTLAGNR